VGGLAAVEHARFTEPADLLDAMPGVVTQVTPLRHDGFFVEITTIRLGDVVLVCGACSPLALVAVSGSATVALQFPLDQVETLVLNGRLLPRFGFCLYGPGATLVRSNTQANTYAALLMPPEVADLHLGNEEDGRLIQPGQFDLRAAGAEDWERMARLLRATAAIAKEAPDMLAFDPPRQALRSSLLGVARDLVRRSAPPAEARRRPTLDAWRQVIMGVEAHLNAHLDRPIYTEELCRTLGVSPARLIEAFHGMLGTTPHRYLKLRRLNLVRAALMRPDQDPPLVKSVALSHGFWHLGQFSHDYREHFGETPSQTLARAHPVLSAGASEADGGRGVRPHRAVGGTT
jgi:AraC family ethanolamine operon transcriptional activator